MKSLLVHLDGSTHGAQRLRVAGELARRFGAHVTALFATTPPLLAIPYGDAGGAAIAQVLFDLQALWRGRAFAAFEDAGLGSDASWAELGPTAAIPGVAEQALYADLTILGQYDADEHDHVLPSDFVPSVLASCGRPALVLPSVVPTPSVGRKALVAWKPTAASARALAAALPLLRLAEEVTVIGYGHAADAGVQGVPLDIDRSLRLHGVQARLEWHAEEPRGELGELLLSRAADLRADLLVMGCYGHSRAREFVLGGVTRTVLASMTLPVLMSH